MSVIGAQQTHVNFAELILANAVRKPYGLQPLTADLYQDTTP
jgi:hypothetical protein